MAAIDYFGIKERIVAILKNDTTNLFSATPSDKTKFRLIEAGAPDRNKASKGPLPRIYVTNDDLVDEMKEIGAKVSNAPKMIKHTMRFLIIVMVDAKDGPKAEETIDDFCKLIIEKLRTLSDLRTPGGAESSQLADESMVERINVINREFIGSNITGRVLRLKVIATST